jgi:branched-chain amino acid aminotransferase
MSLIWFDGGLQAGPIALSAHDRGLTLGDGVFETILVCDKKAIWREDHVARLQAAASALGLSVPLADINAAISALSEQGDGYHVLRLTLTRGVAARGLAVPGLSPSLVATLDPFDPELMFQPVTLVTSFVRRNEFSPSSRMKTLSYVDNILAAREAARSGSDDALMLNSRGHVCCTTIANVFVLRNGQLKTPPLKDGVLPGLARQKLISAFKVSEISLLPADLLQADAVFTTNSLRLIRSVTALDGQALSQADLSVQKAALRAVM